MRRVVPDHPEVRQAAGKYRTRVGMLTIGTPSQARRTTISGSNSIRSPRPTASSSRDGAAQREAAEPAEGIPDGEGPGHRPHERLRQPPAVQPGPRRIGAEDRPAQDQRLRLPARRVQELRHVGRVVLAVGVELHDVRECPLGGPAVAVPEGRAPPAVHRADGESSTHGRRARSRPERLLRGLVAPVVDDQARQLEMGQRVEHGPDRVLVVVDRDRAGRDSPSRQWSATGGAGLARLAGRRGRATSRPAPSLRHPRSVAADTASSAMKRAPASR